MSVTPRKIIQQTTPYTDQKPGTSGLRKKVKVFKQPNYLANLIQATFNVLDPTNKVILVSGDGRYYNEEAVQEIAEIAGGNDASRVIVGLNGWCSTPAASLAIREFDGGIISMAFVLTASHNPGGPNEDFGVKVNLENGEPAPEKVTNAIYEETLRISTIKRVEIPKIELSLSNIQKVSESFVIEVRNLVFHWCEKMETIFDFQLIRELLADPEFKFVIDGMNGIAGPYAHQLFSILRCNRPESLINCTPRKDFGGLHPDPNLIYAKELTNVMGLNPKSQKDDALIPDFGAACDGDADRNMILGKKWFVTPSDSLALICHYAPLCIPYFKSGVIGVARSMPTSSAVTAVAAQLGIPHYEVPTGWKFFGNLMEAGKVSLCGEESFGTSSSHIREKDGLWAVLAWLSIIAYERKLNGKLISVKNITMNMYKTYGRYYFLRYDYEGITPEQAQEVMRNAEHLSSQEGIADSKIFNYTDPIDHSVSMNQGVIVLLDCGSRAVFRLSGTGSVGATIRIYFEKYERTEIDADMFTQTKELCNKIVQLSKITEVTGRVEPSVIT